MFTTDPARRAAYISGLRQLADYQAVSRTAAAMAFHRALHSYDGCVTPDD